MDTGCVWHSEAPAKWEECHKIKAFGSDFCPKHKLLEDEAEAELERKKARTTRRREATKKRKKELLDALKHSPLAAFNPKFAKFDETYSR